MAASALSLALLAACDLGQVAEPEGLLEIVPDSVTLTHIGESFTFTVRSAGGADAGQVRWISRDATVFVVDGNGTVTARGNGVSYVLASDLQAADNALVRVRQVGSALEAIGSGQQTTPGQSLLEPVGVRVLDAGGTPVSGVAVRFEPGPGSGRVKPGEASSDSEGLVVVEWTLGRRPGRQTVRAVSAEGGASVEIAAMALEPDEAVASVEKRSGEDQWALRGYALPNPVAVRVVDEVGRPVWGASVRFEPETGSGRAGPEVALTDSLGLASAVWTLGPQPGAQRLSATAAGGLAVAFGATAVSDEGVCNRTPAVSAEIARTTRAGSCAEVTEEMLGGIISLHLDGKGIRRLGSADFNGLVALETLYLHRNELTELPPSIFAGLSGLRRLLLQSNELTQLRPDIFAGLSSLDELQLARNRLSGLEELVLFQNRLTELAPGTFADLGALREIRVDYNELKELPEDLFDGLSNLRRLYLRGNQLILLPEGIFADLSRLDDVVVAENRLTELPPGLFSETPPVERIALDGNQLTELPPGLFSETPALQRLYLQRNRLTALPPVIFAGLPKLVRLDAKSNRLTELPLGIFAETPKLTELSLDGNELAELPRGVFAGLSDLDWVTLDRNPGAPFPVQPEFARVDAGDLLAPGPARVAVRVPLGAPFAFDPPVSVQRGTVSSEFVSVLPGDTVGVPFMVSHTSKDEGAVHVGFGPLPEVTAAGYGGLELVGGGEELVLFAEADSRSPVARSRVPAHRLQAGGPSAEVVLGDYFDDPASACGFGSVAIIELRRLAGRIPAV